MSFEDLDNKFEKIAQTPRKTDIKAAEDQERANVDEKTKYETTFETTSFTGLLAAFQEKLRNRNPEAADSDKFETINLSSANVLPQTTQPNQQEVSEEQIDALLKKEQTVAENIEVEQTISRHTRYEDVNPTIDKKASRDDITQSPQQAYYPENNPNSTYGETQQIADDEVARQLAIHNQKKAEKKAQEDAKLKASDNSKSE